MLVREFRHSVGRRLVARVGDVVPFEGLKHGGDRKALIVELHDLVHRLAPGDAFQSSAPERLSLRVGP
jgi:hypothetical protein